MVSLVKTAEPKDIPLGTEVRIFSTRLGGHVRAEVTGLRKGGRWPGEHTTEPVDRTDVEYFIDGLGGDWLTVWPGDELEIAGEPFDMAWWVAA